MKLSGSLFGGLFLLSLAACDSGNESLPRGDSADAMGHVAPSAHTAERHAQVQAFLDKMGAEDDADAERGLLAAADDLLIPRVDGGTVWNANAYDFIDGPAPLSVNPSLWRQAGLNNRRGLFEVVPGIYQIRGFDLANMTLISGDTGWIVVDPLTSEETAAAALAFAHEHLPRRPVTTVIFTHSHVDHFGGGVWRGDPGGGSHGGRDGNSTARVYGGSNQRNGAGGADYDPPRRLHVWPPSRTWRSRARWVGPGQTAGLRSSGDRGSFVNYSRRLGAPSH